jgi:uncharacterized protein YdgA (DUF945 family)
MKPCDRGHATRNALPMSRRAYDKRVFYSAGQEYSPRHPIGAPALKVAHISAVKALRTQPGAIHRRRNNPNMKKFLWILLAAVLLVGLAYPASAWYLGSQVELAVNEPYKQVESVPYIKIVKREYRRGVFSSEETVTFELFGDILRLMDQTQKRSAAGNPAATTAGEPLKPFSVTVRSHIKHGPLPDGKTFAAAIVDSELDADERFKPDLAKVLGDKKLVTAHTVYRFDGNGESIVTSPAFVTTLPEEGPDASSQLSWEGVKANVHFTKDLASYTIQGEAPKLEVAGGKGVHVVIAGMRFDTQSKRIFEDEPLLYSGKQKFTVAQASIDGPAMDDKSFLLKQATYDVEIPVNGEFIDIVARLGAQDVLVGATNFGPAHYDFSVKRLHARTVAQLNRAMMKMYSDPAALSAGANPAAVYGPLAKPAMKLLEYNPEISLDRISFKSPQGEVLIAARAKFIDVKPEDWWPSSTRARIFRSRKIC